MAGRGRPKREPTEPLQTKAWFAHVMRVSGVKTVYELEKVLGTNFDKHFYKYERGTHSPSGMWRQLVENTWPGTKAIYEVGPLCQIPGIGSFNVPLWDAVAGSMEEVWTALVWFDSEMEKLRLDGAPYFDRIRKVLAWLSPDAPLDEASLPLNDQWHNEIARLCGLGAISLDLRILTGVIAMWRYSLFVGDGWRLMDYVVRGLCIAPGNATRRKIEDGRWRIRSSSGDSPGVEPVVALLEPWGDIGMDFIALIALIRKENAQARFAKSPELERMLTLFPGDYRR